MSPFMTRLFVGISVLLILILNGACSSGGDADSGGSSTSSGSSDTDSDDDADASSTVDAESLISDSATVASVTASDSSSASLSARSGNSRFKPRSLEYNSERESIADRLAETTLAGCLADLSAPSVVNTTVECYGPQLFVKYHPDLNSATASELPTGDLGIWTSTEESTGEACSSAKANALVDAVGSRINGNLEILAGLACAAEVTGASLATVGDTADLAETLNAELADTNLTTATVRYLRENTTAGTKTYLTTLAGEFAGAAISVTLNNTFSPTDRTSSGRMYGWGENDTDGDGEKQRAGYSIVYDEDATTVRYAFRSMQSAEFSATEPTFFDTSGDIDFSADGFGSDANYGRAEIDGTTGLGVLYFAWQAGSGDGYSRVFQTYAQAGTDGGEDEAISYFGFGPALGTTDNADISGMICNWAGPGNSRSVIAKAQAQVMQRDPVSGVFESTEDYILYAPTNSCDHTATSPDFQSASTTDGTYTDFGTIANELVAYGDAEVGSIPSVDEPVYEDADSLIVATQALYSQIAGIIDEMEVLAESSADSSASEATRFSNQEEIDDLIAEITTIAGNSEFADRLMLQGTDPDEIAPTGTFAVMGSHWNKILDAVNNLEDEDQTITFTYSFIQTGTAAGVNSSNVSVTAVELVDSLNSIVTHDEYMEDIRGALALWEELFERVFSSENGYGHNLTMDFEDRGEETGTSTGVSQSVGLYEIPGTENLGELRFGMKEFGNLVVASPGSPTGNDTEGYGDNSGDIFFGKAIDWRQDYETITSTGNASVMYVAAHELGHGWGLEHDMTSIVQIMNTNNSLSYAVVELFPDGFYNSDSSDKNGISYIYGTSANRVDPGAYTFSDGATVDLPAVGPAALGISAVKVRNTREADAAITRLEAALTTLEDYLDSIAVTR